MPLIVRVSIGRFCSSVVSIVLATFDWVVSMSGASPVTVSVSVRPARDSLKSTVRVELTSSLTFSRIAGCEARQVGLDLIRPGLESRDGVLALLVGDRGPHHARADVGDGDSDSGEHSVSLVENPAVERAGRPAPVRERHGHQHAQCDQRHCAAHDLHSAPTCAYHLLVSRQDRTLERAVARAFAPYRNEVARLVTRRLRESQGTAPPPPSVPNRVE